MRHEIRNGGFTLIELMTGVAVASIIAASAVPSVSAMLSQYRLAATSNLTAAEIAQAREQAGTQQRFVCVYFTAGRLERKAADEGTTDCSNGSEPSKVTEMMGVEFSTSEIRFDPSGLAVVRDPVTITTPTGSRTVTTSILGRVEIS